MKYCFFFFFFSSRRRHTRCSRDWSSDVCSSDLDPVGDFCVEIADRITFVGERHRHLRAVRSEERRVGKSVDLGGRRIIKKKKTKESQSKMLKNSVAGVTRIGS